MTILIMTIFMWLKMNYPLQIAQALAGDSDSESPSLTCSSDFRLLAIMGGLPGPGAGAAAQIELQLN